MIENNTFEIDILDTDAPTPKQAYLTDAGYDVICTQNPVIVGKESFVYPGYYEKIDYIQYHTLIHLGLTPAEGEIPFIEGCDILLPRQKIYFHSNLRSRSSIRKYNLVLANGVGLADPAYIGEYLFCFKYIFQPEDLWCPFDGRIIGRINYEKIYKVGDVIGQLEFQPTYFAKFQKVKSLQQTSRGDKGFGSSDKKTS